MGCNCRPNVQRQIVYVVGDIETASVAEASVLARETGLRPRREIRETRKTDT